MRIALLIPCWLSWAADGHAQARIWRCGNTYNQMPAEARPTTASWSRRRQL
jgi:hypothetical protein